MGINSQDIRRLIQDTLAPLSLWSQDVEELLIMTCAAESDCGAKLFQYGIGPARGIFQMEPATEQDIWDNFLKYRQPLVDKCFKGVQRNLAGNIVYQILMARMHYLRCKLPIPSHSSHYCLAQYYKDIWNTSKGKGSVAGAIAKYEQFK